MLFRAVHRFLLLCIMGLAATPAAAAWPQADAPRQWSFPRDFGSHPEFATEWWYFTGNLTDPSGHRFGYQFTLFRVGLRQQPEQPDNRWSIRDVYLGHFAVTDVTGTRFRFQERVSRSGPGLAGASPRELQVWLLDWSARMEGDSIQLKAHAEEFAVELELNPAKPVVLHGDGGLSRKGPAPGQASYYASLTRLSTRGKLRCGPGGEWREVSGSSWFDQEFGSNQLSQQQAGWDWFSLQLSDGREIMLYFLRRKDGSMEPASSGTLVEAEGASRHLALDQVEVSVQEHWRSPHSGADYPSRWTIRVPSADLLLEVSPLLPDQELRTRGSTGVTYWEGAVSGTGRSGGEKVTCIGYVELTGYAGDLGGLF